MKNLKNYILENKLDNFNDEDFSFTEIGELVKDDSLFKKENKYEWDGEDSEELKRIALELEEELKKTNFLKINFNNKEFKLVAIPHKRGLTGKPTKSKTTYLYYNDEYELGITAATKGILKDFIYKMNKLSNK